MSLIIGHKKIIENLKFLKERDSLPSGFIFTGHSMVGKKTIALAFANFLETGNFFVPEKNVILQDTQLIDASFLKLFSPDAISESIGIDVSREIKKFLYNRPNISSRRTLIIDEAEKMTNEAQNAILKITEEPPESSFIILICSDNNALLSTINSRFQKIVFNPVLEKDIADWLSLDFGVNKKDSNNFAKKSFGNPGIAWRLIFDKKFNDDILLAEKFIKSKIVNRKEMIKEIIDADDFNMRNFLDVVILNLAWDNKISEKNKMWHKVMALYSQIVRFNLNPKLQLQDIFDD